MFGSLWGKEESTAPPGTSVRNLAGSRLSVGVPLITDENQNNNYRIQSAVNRYNSPNFLLKISPRQPATCTTKHASVMTREDQTSTTGADHRELYPGVGNFPTIRLNKTPTLRRPIKRRTSPWDLNVDIPELPTNRLLATSVINNEFKSTRSVLDVLQDLSRKRINLKEEDDVNKRSCHGLGLGGDMTSDTQIHYKPLFVSKRLKEQRLVTTDKTTQTWENTPHTTSTSNTECVSPADLARSERRKYLARRMNDISASLSSSTNLIPSMKRKLGDNHETDVNNIEKRKKQNEITVQHNDKIKHKEILIMNADDQRPPVKKNCEASLKITPVRDHMMTIYFNMQETNLSKKELLISNKLGKEAEKNVTLDDVDNVVGKANTCSTKTDNTGVSQAKHNNLTDITPPATTPTPLNLVEGKKENDLPSYLAVTDAGESTNSQVKSVENTFDLPVSTNNSSGQLVQKDCSLSFTHNTSTFNFDKNDNKSKYLTNMVSTAVNSNTKFNFSSNTQSAPQDNNFNFAPNTISPLVNMNSVNSFNNPVTQSHSINSSAAVSINNSVPQLGPPGIAFSVTPNTTDATLFNNPVPQSTPIDNKLSSMSHESNNVATVASFNQPSTHLTPSENKFSFTHNSSNAATSGNPGTNLTPSSNKFSFTQNTTNVPPVATQLTPTENKLSFTQNKINVAPAVTFNTPCALLTPSDNKLSFTQNTTNVAPAAFFNNPGTRMTPENKFSFTQNTTYVAPAATFNNPGTQLALTENKHSFTQNTTNVAPAATFNPGTQLAPSDNKFSFSQKTTNVSPAASFNNPGTHLTPSNNKFMFAQNTTNVAPATTFNNPGTQPTPGDNKFNFSTNTPSSGSSSSVFSFGPTPTATSTWGELKTLPSQNSNASIFQPNAFPTATNSTTNNMTQLNQNNTFAAQSTFKFGPTGSLSSAPSVFSFGGNQPTSTVSTFNMPNTAPSSLSFTSSPTAPFTFGSSSSEQENQTLFQFGGPTSGTSGTSGAFSFGSNSSASNLTPTPSQFKFGESTESSAFSFSPAAAPSILAPNTFGMFNMGTGSSTQNKSKSSSRIRRTRS